MKVKNLKLILDAFDDDAEVIVSIFFGDHAEICDIETVSDNGGHAQLKVISQN